LLRGGQPLVSVLIPNNQTKMIQGHFEEPVNPGIPNVSLMPAVIDRQNNTAHDPGIAFRGGTGGKIQKRHQ